MQKIAHDKLKSSNERELERYFRQKREEAMAKQLAAIRKNQTREMMTGNVFANNKNLFSGHKSVLNDDSSLFTRSNL